jgi:hypothetical protein
LAIVQYAYDSGKLKKISTLRKDGSVRFTDSLLYDWQGRNVEELRISSAGVKTYFHRYTLNTQGKIIADSLFELVSTSYIASQAQLFTYNSDLTVATQTQWRRSDASWYCISTTFMSYSAGALVSVATHDREDGATTDSLAYEYDPKGNLSKEEKYDGSKVLVQRIIYTWRDTQPLMVHMSGRPHNDQGFVLSYKQGCLIADLPLENRGMITIFNMAGKQICQLTIGLSPIVPLPEIISKGSYIAVFSTNKINRQKIKFNN